MDETTNELGEYISQTLGEKVLRYSEEFGILTIEANASDVVDVCRFLRDDIRCLFINLTDICGVDWPNRELRFDCVYHLLSPEQNMRARIKVACNDVDPVPSLTEIFPSAEWFEREVYDMYGVLFSSHPDLRRILTDYGFDGYPLRKDFPVSGFVEVRYDNEQKRVVYEPVHLTQEFRNFDFLSPWEGTEYQLPGDEKESTG